MRSHFSHRVSRRAAVTAVAAATVLSVAWAADPAQAVPLVPVNLAGSTWAENIIETWAASEAAGGVAISYTGNGSAAGAQAFAAGTVDAAVVDAQYADGSAGYTTTRRHVFVPLTFGAVAFAYQIKAPDGTAVTNLRLSPHLIALIFSRGVTMWNDPLIAAENPGVVLPALGITPVVRQDAAATSDEVGRWLSSKVPADWARVCAAAGQAAGCAPGPLFPANAGDMAVAGATGAIGFVMQPANNGAITFVENNYAAYYVAPTAQVENASGTYRAPTAGNAAVALQSVSEDDTTGVVNLGGAADSLDPRAYPVLTVSYLLAQTTNDANYTINKSTTLYDFSDSALCIGQNNAERLGYVPITGSLLDAARGAERQIPWSPDGMITPVNCADYGDALAASVPMPGATGPGSAGEILGTVLPPGALVISVAGDPHVVLPSPVLDDTGTDLHTSGTLTPITVTDNRAGAPGWTVSGQVTDFSDGTGDAIDGGFLSWQPQVIGGPGLTGAVAGAAVARGSGGLKTPRVLATGTGLGTVRVGAELDLDAPTTTLAGTYVATFTVTAI